MQIVALVLAVRSEFVGARLAVPDRAAVTPIKAGTASRAPTVAGRRNTISHV